MEKNLVYAHTVVVSPHGTADTFVSAKVKHNAANSYSELAVSVAHCFSAAAASKLSSLFLLSLYPPAFISVISFSHCDPPSVSEAVSH